MKKLIIANWKMSPATLLEAEENFSDIERAAGKMKGIKTVICPPFVWLYSLNKARRGGAIALGAQDVFWQNPTGSFTGEISAAMLKACGAGYVIIGHSERRRNLQETDEMIGRKIKMALKSGLKVILCVGEPERDEAGEYLKFIKMELLLGLNEVKRNEIKNLVVAYEPIWAISSSKNARLASQRSGPDTPQELFRMTIYIKRVIFSKFGKIAAQNLPVLYGGSVDAKNIADFINNGNVQGVLVGRASWKPETFIPLLKNI